MRTYPGVRPALFNNPDERAQIKIIDDMLRQVSGALAKSVLPGQQPAANPISSTPPATPTTPGFPVPTQGDLIYGLLTGSWNKLPIGQSGQLLTVVGGSPSWTTPAATTHNILSATHTDTTGAGAETRGDLVVRNNSSQWARLATGSSTQVLKGGTDPSWGTIDNTFIDNRTRTLFIPANTWVTAVPATLVGTFPTAYGAIQMPNAGAVDATATIILPQDFVAGGAVSWKVHYVNLGASANGVHWDLYYKIVSDAEDITSANDQSMSSDSTPSATANTLDIFQVGTTNTSLLAGDLVKLSIRRNPADGGDTNAGDMDFIGLQLDYTADM